MSDVTRYDSPASGPPPEAVDTGDALPSPQPRQRKRRWTYLVLALVLILGAASVAGVYWLRPEEDDGPDYPTAWDSRVQQYVDVVEDERGLTFKHPIHVDFLSVKDFKRKVTTDDEDLTDEDRKEIKQYAGLLRAAGLIEGEFDLLDTVNRFQGAGVLGYYDGDDERIRIRGTKLTPAIESTLVHELTHAVQDQYFNIEERKDKLDKAEDNAASSAFEAVVEGDARRIEAAWVETLSKAEKKALRESEAEQTEKYKQDAADVPEIIETLMTTEYVFGEALLYVAEQDGGKDGVNDLFKHPPTNDEHQFDPWTHLEDHDKAAKVTEPDLDDGEKEFDDGPFGAITWLLLLAERIPVKQALDAVDGWGGDAYIGYERDDTSCMKVRYEGETSEDLHQMHEALTAWIRRLPNSPATVSVAGTQLLFETCDAGPKATAVATGGSRGAVALAVSRTYLAATLEHEANFPTPLARCSATRLMHEYTVTQLNNSNIDPKRARRLVASCQT